MTITRILPGVVLMAFVTAGPVAGQYNAPSYSSPGRGGPVIPSVLPNGAPDPVPTSVQTAGGWTDLGTLPSVTNTFGGGQSGQNTSAPTGLGRLPGATYPGSMASDPIGTLTTPTGAAPRLGTYPPPGFIDGPGCCGPIGRNGPVTYELYAYTGPDFVLGGGQFLSRLQVGWDVSAGGRSLFFNPAGDAAWVVGLGVDYVYNRGSSRDLLDLFIRQPAGSIATASGATIVTPTADQLITSRIKELDRTWANVSLGRDWFVWGPGNAGAQTGWNLRFGLDVEAQWGSVHVDVIPGGDPANFARRQNAFEGVGVGAHLNAEAPFGGWIWFGGVRFEAGYQWTNVVPPVNGDVAYINLLLTTGVRF